jgi:hypothetical protein
LELVLKEIILHGVHFQKQLIHLLHIILKPIRKEVIFVEIVFQQRILEKEIIKIGFLREKILLVELAFEVLKDTVSPNRII